MLSKTTYLTLKEENTIETDIQAGGLNIRRKIYEIMIGRDYLSRFYSSNLDIRFNNLKNTGELKIIFLKDNSPIHLNVDQNILGKLSEYLINRESIEKDFLGLGGGNNLEFDCSDFIYFLVGWEKGNKIIPIKDDGSYKKSDIVCIYNENDNEGYHFALFLGEGLFLSKYGSFPISISTLEQMKDFYNSDSSVKVLSYNNS